ncbi:transposase family protein [Streptomyces sp. NPDC055722]
MPDGQGSKPGCGSWSGRAHGSYLRLPAGRPVAGRWVVLRLRVRRFTCEEVSCGRTFVDQVAGLTRRYRQRTERPRSSLAEAGLALAGGAGTRLADIFGVRVNRKVMATAPRTPSHAADNTQHHRSTELGPELEKGQHRLSHRRDTRWQPPDVTQVLYRTGGTSVGAPQVRRTARRRLRLCRPAGRAHRRR